MKILKTGDTCPCCGSPIQVTDPASLLVLNLLSAELARQAGKIDAQEYNLFHRQLVGAFSEVLDGSGQRGATGPRIYLDTENGGDSE